MNFVLKEENWIFKQNSWEFVKLIFNTFEGFLLKQNWNIGSILVRKSLETVLLFESWLSNDLESFLYKQNLLETWLSNDLESSVKFIEKSWIQFP